MSRPRLLLFNLMTDSADPVLGFTSVWIRALARRCESLDVITMYQGALDLPDNARVFSAGRERGLNRAARLAIFYRHLLRLLAAAPYDACFAHMMPLFAGLAGPLLTARGIPTVLWYAHRQKSAQLRLGLMMSRRAVSADATSFPYATDKLRVIGHGIDADFYAPGDPVGPSSPRRPLVVQVGRLAAIKHQKTTIRAVAKTETALTLVGGLQAGYPAPYAHELETMIQRFGLADRTRLTGDLPPLEVRGWYRRADIAVNMSPVGLFDKTALESMACATPTVVCNPAFAPLLGDYRHLLLIDGPRDAAGLRRSIEGLLSLSAAERAQIGQTLRAHVIRQHSLASLMPNLLSVLQTGELPPT